MSDWVSGYRAALADVERLMPGRAARWPHGLTMDVVVRLLADLDQDALVIEREQDNRIRRRRLAAAREATLFDEPPT